ncbi:MAG: hypothetical protein ACXW29_00640 [Thermoanaerobaculia bacterium]
MSRKMLNTFVLLCAVTAGAGFLPSCRGEAAAVTALPNPGDEDRPPGSPPELPRLSVELPTASPNTPTRILSQGDDLQDALDDAKPGDLIALQPGAIFRGPFTLPKKNADGWITIRTNLGDGAFVAPGTRVAPSDARLMPVIESDSDFAITTDAGAHHYRFIGIEVRPQSGVFVRNLITLGTDTNSFDALPHHLVFERCYVHGDPKVGGRRGIALNSRHTAIIDSYISDFKETGNDSQALAGWSGAGPFAILNNYLEAAGENLMFGGADPDVKNLVPSDIEIRGNLFAKPLGWKKGSVSYAGTSWSVKNLFELKNARRVLIDGNVFENNWLDAQNGFAILFTPRNQDGGAPWSMVRDVTFTRNTVRHAGSGMNILGTDDLRPSEQTKRITIRDNVFEDVDGAKWGGAGRLFQILDGAADVVIEHNTAFHTGDVVVGEGDPNTGFVYRNNLTPHNQYGVGGSNTYGNPQQALATYFPGAVFVKNVMIGGRAQNYPPDNFFPATAADVGFVDLAGGDYHLAANSPYKAAATDGRDIGAVIDGADAQRGRRRIVGRH